jgi:hypothetical protein
MRWSWKYFGTFFIVLLIEIGIERFFKTGFIRYFMGDFFIVMLLYFGLKAIVSWKKRTVLLAVLGFAFVVEFLQLANLPDHFGWSDNRLIHLTLGSSYDPLDLLAYFLGGITAIAIDHLIFSRQKKSA